MTDYPLKVKGTTYQPKVVEVTQLHGSGSYDTGPSMWAAAAMDDIRKFLLEIPARRGRVWVEVQWTQADPPEASECEQCPTG